MLNVWKNWFNGGPTNTIIGKLLNHPLLLILNMQQYILCIFQAQIMESLPLILFGTMSVTSGLFVLLFPETLNTKLPDTIEEAEVIGRKEPVGSPL